MRSMSRSHPLPLHSLPVTWTTRCCILKELKYTNEITSATLFARRVYAILWRFNFKAKGVNSTILSRRDVLRVFTNATFCGNLFSTGYSATIALADILTTPPYYHSFGEKSVKRLVEFM